MLRIAIKPHPVNEDIVLLLPEQLHVTMPFVASFSEVCPRPSSPTFMYLVKNSSPSESQQRLRAVRG